VSESLLLDTHIALWLDSGNERLLPSTRVLIDQCWRGGGSLLLSAISAWEIALLVDARRIDLDCSVEAWVERFVDRPGFAAVPLSHRAAVGAYKLYHLEHRDPGDRLLIAAAIELRCPLVTYDTRIGAFGAEYGSRYGFVVRG
jgi:PIN domain nuclease of toxin-antitoxin system